MVFKVTGLNKVTKGVKCRQKRESLHSELRDGFRKKTGALLGMLRHLEFDLARTEANSSIL